MKRIISGVKPTGKIHIGNYFGAMRQHIALQNEFETYIFIADMHSLTSEKNPENVRENTYEIALNYLALGLDPEKVIFFKQSDIPAHTELFWILDCVTQMPFLERGHAWKDATAKGQRDPNVGLFNYPVLMAADILLYSADLVPVGKDQKQHIEITRDIAQSFNHLYGETLKIPEEYIVPEVETVPGTDGQKMSKSYNNIIQIFGSEDVIKKQIMGIVTDSKGVDDPKDPEKCNLFAIYKLFTNASEQATMSESYKKGGIGYGEIKKELLAKFLSYFKEARSKYEELKPQKEYINKILEKGKINASKIAENKIKEIKSKVGLL